NRVGGQEQVAVDVRVIAATNRSAAQAIADGKLREDLYFRLSTFPVRVPGLRERPGDVDLLVQHFLEVFNGADGVHKTITPETVEMLCGYVWPGNVRELKNLLQRAYILADDEIGLEHFPPLEGVAVPAAQGGTLTVP